MKKIILIFALVLASIFALSGCDCSNKKEIDYVNYVSELRSNLYEGKSDNYSLKASYGFKETPYQNDGKIGKKIYLLSFKLEKIENLEISYFLKFTHADKTYEKQFSLNHNKNALTCEIEIKDFTAQNFTVEVGTLQEKESVVMQSIIPKNALDFKGAIQALIKNQPSLIESYTNSNGEFNGEIYARILVKDGKAYWYIGIANGNGALKALLIDGMSGEVLAVREVF